MDTFSPGSTATITQTGLPSGAAVGFQVLKANSNTVAIGRTAAGVTERPAGTGNYVFNFIVPAEGDLYLLVIDWNAGVMDPLLSRVVEFTATETAQVGSTGLGAVADYASVNLGGETWNALRTATNFGDTQIARAVEIIKSRALNNTVVTADEAALPGRVLDYLGVLAALELIPAARDNWAQSETSRTFQSDPTEMVTFVNRAQVINDLRNELLSRLPAIEKLALPLIDSPLVQATSSGPAIDEDDDCRVTADPRRFPSYAGYNDGPFGADPHVIVRKVIT